MNKLENFFEGKDINNFLVENLYVKQEKENNITLNLVPYLIKEQDKTFYFNIVNYLIEQFNFFTFYQLIFILENFDLEKNKKDAISKIIFEGLKRNKTSFLKNDNLKINSFHLLLKISKLLNENCLIEFKIEKNNWYFNNLQKTLKLLLHFSLLENKNNKKITNNLYL